MPSSPRQTLSYLRQLFEERGIKPKNKLGQNFLIDLNLVDLIVRSAELTKSDLALEVGTGTGSLTTRLADQAGAVVTVELDRAFQDLIQELLSSRPNVVQVHADVLKNKNELNPEVLSALEAAQKQSGCTHIKLVANLPYLVATPVISNLLLSDVALERMIVTVQWEIAARMLAAPGTKDYGALAVLVQSLADVQLIRRLSPGVFWPRPKVESAIIRIDSNAEKRRQVGDVVRFRHFLRDLYTHRRKNLRGALAALPNHRRDKSAIDVELAKLGLEGSVRAESLGLEDHLRMCRVFGVH
jgi:16S rRNA (adenine1518-N6/adenine1519-N6)-dimethyltransferase